MSDSGVPPPHPAGSRGRVLFLMGRLEPTAICRAILALARRLNRLDHQVEMICRSGNAASVDPRRALQNGDGLPPVALSRALATNLRGYLSLGRLARRVAEIDTDVLHVHGSRLAGVAARLARRVRKPYVLSIGDFIDPGQSLAMSRRFLKAVLVASDAVRVDLVNRLRVPRDLIQLVPDGVDIERYVVHEPRLGGPALPVVGTMGRLDESKGHEFFIRAVHLLAVRGRRAHFVIAGDGPDRKRLQNLVAELDLADRITFARAPINQLEVLKAIDILVVPALREALGLPAIEAMACGIPVIATSAGGIFSLIENGRTGILVAKKDPDAIANQVERLIDDPGLAAELAAQGRARVAESFDIRTTAERTSAIYESVAGTGAAAALGS